MTGRSDDRCRDCGVEPGERHRDGCDVALCKGCGSQALQCTVHEAMPMTVWTGEWPGETLAAELGVDLNDLARMHADGRLVWDVDAERLVGPPSREAEAERIVRALATVGPVSWDDEDGSNLCGACGGFEMPYVGLTHQPGCILLAARRWAEKS